MQTEDNSKREKLVAELTAQFKCRVPRPVMGEETAFAPELLRRLHDFIFWHELTPKEQATLKLYEFQTLLLELALLEPEELKLVRLQYPGKSKFEVIVARTLDMLRTNPKYWLDRAEPSSNLPENAAIEEYNKFCERTASLPKGKRLCPADWDEVAPSPRRGSDTQSFRGPICLSPGLASDLFHYARTFCEPATRFTDLILQSTILLLCSSPHRTSETEISTPTLGTSERDAQEFSTKVTESGYDFRAVSGPAASLNSDWLPEMKELWVHPELMAFDFFLGSQGTRREKFDMTDTPGNKRTLVATINTIGIVRGFVKGSVAPLVAARQKFGMNISSCLVETVAQLTAALDQRVFSQEEIDRVVIALAGAISLGVEDSERLRLEAKETAKMFDSAESSELHCIGVGSLLADVNAAVEEYKTYVESPRTKQLLEYKYYSEEKRPWSREDYERFEEALQLFKSSPMANRKIAKYMGSHIQPNHVRYEKKAQMKRLQKGGDYKIKIVCKPDGPSCISQA